MDRIANLLSTIKNAYLINKPSVETPYSRQLEEIALVLKKHGFVEDVKVFKFPNKTYKGLHIDLSYDDKELPVLMDLKRLSKPGRRIYKKAEELLPVRGGYGLLVVSTSRGVMSGQEARKKRLGGELICKVW